MNHKCHHILSFILILLLTSAGESVFAQGSDTIRIATYNIRYANTGDTGNRNWSVRKTFVGNIIKSNRFDIFGVQEIGSATQQSDLIAQIPGYSIFWKGRNNNEGTTGERAAIIYRTSRFQMLENGWFFLSETPYTYSIGWDAQLARICMWARMYDTVSEKEFYFFNTHFDHAGVTARTESAKLVLSQINIITGDSDLPVFLTGDFNFSTETGSTAYATLLEGGLSDSRKIAPRRQTSGPVGTANNWNWPASNITESKRIDFIYLNQKSEVLSYTAIDTKYVDDAYPSDHFPALITVKIKEVASGLNYNLTDAGLKMIYANDEIRISGETPFACEIYNSIGVLKSASKGKTNDIAFKGLDKGIYIIKTTNGQATVSTKIIIN
jgi:endonuclease/exonuclease/phosphatase family metal-dependent hydrolase